MAPLRNNRRSNRSGRTQVDHDIMEGLPVRQWRVQPSAINTAPPKETSASNNGVKDRWTELAMPKGSELYSPMAQALLRAARKGQVNRPPSLPIDDERDDEEDADGELDTGFVTMRWTQIPKDQDRPEPEFLAKRRKGLPLFPEDAAAYTGKGVSMRKVRVKKIDAQGNVSVFDVLAPEGTAVEGEILDGEEIATEAPAPGTVVEGVGIANAEGIVVATEQVAPTPPRRRPPPPKRKAKGPGRGRKKKASAAASSANAVAPAKTVQGEANGGAASADTLEAPGAHVQAAANGDVEMGDDSAMPEGEDGSEDDDDDSEKGDKEDGEILENDSPSKPTSPPKSSKPLPSSLKPKEEAGPSDNAHGDGDSPAKPLSPLKAAKPVPAPISTNEELEVSNTSLVDTSNLPKQSSPRKEAKPVPAPLLPKSLALSKVATGRDPSTSPDVPLASATFSPTHPKEVTRTDKESETSPAPILSPTAAVKSPTRKRSIPNKRAPYKALQPAPLPSVAIPPVTIPSSSTDVLMSDAPSQSTTEPAASAIASLLNAPATEAVPPAPIIPAAELAQPKPSHAESIVPPSETVIPPTPMLEENRPVAPAPVAPTEPPSLPLVLPSPPPAAAAAAAIEMDTTPPVVQDPAEAKLQSPVVEASIPQTHNPLKGLVEPQPDQAAAAEEASAAAPLESPKSGKQPGSGKKKTAERRTSGGAAGGGGSS